MQGQHTTDVRKVRTRAGSTRSRCRMVFPPFASLPTPLTGMLPGPVVIHLPS
jgi:hypothetical protein